MNNQDQKKISLANFDFEQRLMAEGYSGVIGIDEAGRGPLAGPVVAAATMVKDFPLLVFHEQNGGKQVRLIRDSKKLSEKQRESVYDFITENFYVGVGICDQATIDRMNILEATFLAMKKALSALRNKLLSDGVPINKVIILTDGNKLIPNLSEIQKAVVSGDQLVKSISAASIIAKVTRDRIMAAYHQEYPQYGFATHKGYGTQLHMEALRQFGPCRIHRKSFAPVRRRMKQEE